MGLPEDLVFEEILSKLTPKSLMRFKCVSKSWWTRISDDSSFIEAHLTHHAKAGSQLIFTDVRTGPVGGQGQMMMRLSDEKSTATEIDMPCVYPKDSHGICSTTLGRGCVTIVGSCNGLVCLALAHYMTLTDQLLLWNPATRHVRWLPISFSAADRSEYLCPSAIGLGFGFDTASKDYKVVRLCRGWRSAEGPLFFSIHVFAKSGAFWRDRGVVSGLTEYPWIYTAVAVQGALHWVTSYPESPGRVRVASFDLHDEVLRLIDGPVDDNFYILASLCKWSDSLAMLTFSQTSELRMWASTYSGSVRTWNNIYKFTWPLTELSRWVWKGRFVAMREELPGGRVVARLVLVDPEAPHLETDLELPDDCTLPVGEAFDYSESLVSVF